MKRSFDNSKDRFCAPCTEKIIAHMEKSDYDRRDIVN